MSTVFTKSKEKCSRSSSNEAKYSFVKNVTSRVSGLLPSTITKWFSSPSTSSANGSAPAADATDSSTEDEAPESPITIPPPSKRMRFSPPGKYNNFPTDVSCVSNNMDNFEQCAPYNNSFIQSLPGRTMLRRETNFVSNPVRAPTAESPIDKSERDSTVLKTQHTLSATGPSVATKRKSIFETTNNKTSKRACEKTASSTFVDPKAPSFKPSLFGSPFYPGQTVYGGASSTYINHPNIKHRQVALVKESNSNDNTSMSYSARRVMDLLENYASPLVEARRISPYVKSFKNDSCNDSKNTSVAPYSQKVISYKTQELHVPNIASVLGLKHKSRLMDTTNAARQIIASHSSTDMAVQTEYVPYARTKPQKDPTEKKTDGKFTTKVKSRLTRPKRGESDIDSQMAAPVKLPTAVLQIDKNNMPKFLFGTTPSTSTPSSATPAFCFTSTPISKPVSETITKRGDTALCKIDLSKPELPKPETVTNINSYKFSSPVRLSSEALLTASTPPKFTFSSPDCFVDKPIVAEKKDDGSSCVVGTSKETEKLSVPKAKDWQCADCWVFNKTDANKCVCCGGKKPSDETAKPSKCCICKLTDSQSHINKCVNCEKVHLNNTTKLPPIQNVKDLSKWKCEDCWVLNAENIGKCVCCGAKNPKKTSVTPSLPAVDNSPKSVSVTTTEWKCDDCWIKNKSNVDKCAACGGAKPGSKPTTTASVRTNYFGSTVIRTLDTSSDNVAKLPSDCWECSICMVKNEKNRSKCFCCETAKPGSVKDFALKFNFSKTPNTSFLFGIDPNKEENKIIKSAEESSAEVPKKPEESETNNNTLPKTPSFSFGIPPKKADDQIDTAKGAINKSSKLSFTFGVPTTQPTSEPNVDPMFGSANKLSENTPKKVANEYEQLQEVPKVEFTLPAPKETTTKPLTNIFGSQLATPTASDKLTAPVPTLLGSQTTIEKEDSISVNETPAQNSGTFSGPRIKLAVNLFASPTSTVPSFVAPVQAPASTISLFQKPETTTTASISLFKKPDIATTSTVSLFQKSDTTTTSAPLSLAATAPIFSFGSNSMPAAAAPQPDNPKFNFTFGNNTSIFNNSFGAPSTDNNTTKFGITENRSATGGNGLSSSNALAGGNGLAANKLGTQNEVPTKSLPARTELQQPATGLFGAPVQNDNLWSSPNNNSSNLFVSNASSTPMQKPATFTFGSSTPFNASNPTPAFGNRAPNANNPTPAFGSSAPNANNPTPAFGSSAPSTSNQTPAFGGSTPNKSNPTPAFGSITSNKSNPTPAFGSITSNKSNPTPAFGSITPNKSNPTPAFGSSAPNANNPTPAFGSIKSNPTPAFGSSAPNTSNQTPAFGSSTPNKSNQTPVFGSITPNKSNPTPAFGSSTPQSQNVFGINQNASSPATLFSSPVQSQPAPSMFSSAQTASAPAPVMGLFGSTNVGFTPTFGSPTPAIPTPSTSPSPTAAFNFGASQSMGVFGFGTPAQQPQQPPAAGVYSFGAAAAAAPQVQFNMGSSPNTGMRRVRKAVRRNSQR